VATPAAAFFSGKQSGVNERTALYDRHLAAGARIVPFAGWDMPLHYGSQLTEHHAVRRGAGVFDVSHMTVVDIEGPASTDYLRSLLANDVAKLAAAGRGLYGCMLTETGGVVDDLICYRLGPDRYRLIVNAGTRDKDLAWLRARLPAPGVALRHRTDRVMLAVQGPEARERAASLLPVALREPALELAAFACVEHDGVFVSRTGYTGEDGWELVLSAAAGVDLWDRLLDAGVSPCGLGARDTLRLEAGLNLYGQDMDEEVTPLECGLAWTVAWDPPERAFIGRSALVAQRSAGVARRQAGLLLDEGGIMRHGQRVLTDAGEGIITSGGFSPTLERSIALARLPAAAAGPCRVEIRSSLRAARVVEPRFVREGRGLIEVDKPGP